MLSRRTFGAALFFVTALGHWGTGTSHSAEAPEHRIVPLQPMSRDVEVIHGDPDVAGKPFVMRIRELPGTIIPPHKHPVDEHITVVQGTIYFAVGEKFDRAALQQIKTGGYAFIPKGSTMFGYIPDAAIVQVHGIGPFQSIGRGRPNAATGVTQHTIACAQTRLLPRLDTMVLSNY